MEIKVSVIERNADEVALLLKMLGHPLRLELLKILHAGELKLMDLSTPLGISPSHAELHLNLVRGVKIVGMRRDGPYAFYRLEAGPASQFLEALGGVLL